MWFRRDLRLADNPALAAAAERGGAVIPMFVWAPQEEGEWPPGGASRWWLDRSLQELDAELRRHGSRLVVRSGPSPAALREVIAETGARAVVWNRRYEPAAIATDRAVKAALAAQGVEAHSFNSALLHEPWEISTAAGDPYRVFTAFWQACLREPPPPPPVPAPGRLIAPRRWPASEPAGIDPDPSGRWSEGLSATWTPGERGAHDRAEAFLDRAAAYPGQRDRVDLEGTSRLSPHLHFGELDPRQLWHEIHGRGIPADRYLAELGWREFAHHLLFHFPHTAEHPLQDRFEAFPWERDPDGLRRWQRGQTGYPLVDAGMRQLWRTGWMHNRARMVTASFLVKDLLIDWREGARWFWDTLVDADLANNTLGWQWTAGCGADAAPFFRVFNPTLQARRFDPDGAYVERFVPERGTSEYPEPIVDHAAARQRSLDLFERLRVRERAASSGR